MFRTAVLILRDDDVAHDIVHDVFETLLTSRISNVSSQYLLCSVRNRCLNYIRNLTIRERFKRLYSGDHPEDMKEDFMNEESLAMIETTIKNELSDRCRTVVNLRFIEGKSYKEIAEILGISEVAVYKHLRHAIEVLRLKISRHG